MGNVGLFCVHGFLEDSEQSFYHFKKALKKNNIQNYFMTNLQGHGLDEDINTFNYKKCLSQVELEYSDYKSKYEDVYLIGFSMGGVIASHLASKFGASKLVLISPAFKYGQTSQFAKDFINLMNRTKADETFPSVLELFNFKRGERLNMIQEFVNEEYKDLGSSYEDFLFRLSRLKPSTFLNFTRLVATVKKTISLDNIPTRIYHAEFDELVPVGASLYIFGKIKSKDKRLTLVAGVHHRILASNIKDDVIDEIIDFYYGEDYFKKSV